MLHAMCRLAMRAMLVALAAATPSSPRAADGGRPAVAALQVSLLVDPRLSGPTYGGERWTSASPYVGTNAQDTVEARATATIRGRPLRVDAQWRTSDPELVTIARARGDRVRLVVRRPGESTVTVSHGGASRTLTVKAERPNGRWQVTITHHR